MKKQIKWLVAALALSALATPAFAVTADMTGMITVRGLATDNFDRDDDVNDNNVYADQRLRLWTNVAANENAKLVFGIEVDNNWGRVKTTGKEIGALGTDAKGEIEIKHLYVDFNIPSLKANVKAGSQAVNFGRGFILNDDAAALQVSMPCKLVPANTLSLMWVKTSEANEATPTASNGARLWNDEGDFYAAKYAIKAGDVTVAPYAGYYQTGDNTALTYAKDAYAGIFGVDVDGKAGALSYSLTGIYEDFSLDGESGDGLALFAKGAYATGDTTLSLEVARYGSEDYTGGNLLTIQDVAATGAINNFSEILTGGMYTSNSNYYANVGGAANLYSTNYFYAKLGAVQKLSDAAKASLYVMHIEQANDSPTADKITYGQEVDAYFDYTVVPGVTLNLAGAYLFADSDFGDDDPWKLASSVTYKF